MANIFIIEHLEPELFEWCILEYREMSKIVGKDNLWFTNIKQSDISKINDLGKIFTESVKSMKLDNPCVLDMESPNTLITKDKEKFNFFIFGGILGDYPPRKRTKDELTKHIKNAQIRNIGKEQFSTDNAVLVTKMILDGEKLEEMKFQDELTIEIDDIESTILPFRYPLINGKPHISQELVEYIKKDEGIS
jgi:ribosome biogenesis SPOUT family RNA methylase Rps3